MFQALSWVTPLLFKLLSGTPAALDNLRSSFKTYLKGHLKQTCFQCPGWSESFPPGGRPLPGHWAAERLVEAHSEGVPGTHQVEAGGSSCARSQGGRGLGTRPCVLPAAAEASCRAGLFRSYCPSSSHLPSSRNSLPFPPTRPAHILS